MTGFRLYREFHTPPRNQGHIVEVSYASADGMIVRRICDRSDGSSRYALSRQQPTDEGDYWNQAPRNRRWRTVTEEKAQSILREDE